MIVVPLESQIIALKKQLLIKDSKIQDLNDKLNQFEDACRRIGCFLKHSSGLDIYLDNKWACILEKKLKEIDNYVFITSDIGTIASKEIRKIIKNDSSKFNNSSY